MAPEGRPACGGLDVAPFASLAFNIRLEGEEFGACPDDE